MQFANRTQSESGPALLTDDGELVVAQTVASAPRAAAKAKRQSERPAWWPLGAAAGLFAFAYTVVVVVNANSSTVNASPDRVGTTFFLYAIVFALITFIVARYLVQRFDFRDGAEPGLGEFVGRIGLITAILVAVMFVMLVVMFVSLLYLPNTDFFGLD